MINTNFNKNDHKDNAICRHDKKKKFAWNFVSLFVIKSIYLNKIQIVPPTSLIVILNNKFQPLIFFHSN